MVYADESHQNLRNAEAQLDDTPNTEIANAYSLLSIAISLDRIADALDGRDD